MSSPPPPPAARRLRVLMLNPRYVVGRRNSDLRTYAMLKELEPVQPVDFAMCGSSLLALQANFSYALAAGFWRTRLPANSDTSAKVWNYAKRSVWLPRRVVQTYRPDAIYTLLLFPVNRVDVPIVLDMDFNPWGIPAIRDSVDRLLYVPRWVIERSAVVMVRHEVSMAAFRKRFPDQAHKGIIVPSPLPGCEAIPEDQVRAKFAAFGQPQINLLFVGNASREKGVRELLQAYLALKDRYPLKFTVVSAFTDGPVSLPPDVRVLSDIPPSEVYRIMAETHIFALPATHDSHSRVFWEAMANGCTLIAPCFTPHQELFGEFGLTADSTSVASITRSLETLVANPQLCLERAIHARAMFLKKYHYSIAIAAYYEAFRRAAEPSMLPPR